MQLSDKTRNIVYYSGIALLIGGAALAYWSIQKYEGLPNYQRLALLLPMFASGPLMHVDDFRNWDSIPTANRIKAAGAVIVPVILFLGAAIWWLTAPGARA